MTLKRSKDGSKLAKYLPEQRFDVLNFRPQRLQDMFGLTALHKFASWDKPDLLQLLLPYLTEGDVNTQSGEEGYRVL